MGTRRTVTVYTRRGCHLCEDAIALVTRVAAGRADVELVDIDGDVNLYERYTVRVPVVAVDGVDRRLPALGGPAGCRAALTARS